MEDKTEVNKDSNLAKADIYPTSSVDTNASTTPRKKPIIILIGIIIAILLLAVVVVINMLNKNDFGSSQKSFSRSSDASEKYKYISLDNKISYQKPTGWIEVKYENYISFRSPDHTENNLSYIANGAEINVFTQGRVTDMTLIEYAKSLSPGRPKNIEFKELTIGNKKVINAFYCYEHCYDKYFYSDSNFFSNIVFVCAPNCDTKENADKNKYSQDRDAFLATFKFTNTKEKIDTTSWKTFTSPCGFTIKYPSDYSIKAGECDKTNLTIRNTKGKMFWLNVHVINNIDVSDVNEAVDKYYPMKNEDKISIIVDGYPGIKSGPSLNEQAGSNGVGIFLAALKDEDYFQFNLTGNQEIVPVWDEMVSTIKFQ